MTDNDHIGNVVGGWFIFTFPGGVFRGYRWIIGDVNKHSYANLSPVADFDVVTNKNTLQFKKKIVDFRVKLARMAYYAEVII